MDLALVLMAHLRKPLLTDRGTGHTTTPMNDVFTSANARARRRIVAVWVDVCV
jgi:hypothetical protein